MKSLFPQIVFFTSRLRLIKLPFGVHNLAISIKIKMSLYTCLFLGILLMISNLSMNSNAACLTKNSWAAAYIQEAGTKTVNRSLVHFNRVFLTIQLNFTNNAGSSLAFGTSKAENNVYCASAFDCTRKDISKPEVYAGRLILHTENKAFPGPVTIVHKQ